MNVIVDNIELDKDNAEYNYADEFVRQADKLFYLTGKAGTGKTTFLKYIETTDKNTVILAPTGVAAINAGGVTIHSFSQIPFGPFIPDDSRLRTNASGTESIYKTFNYNGDKRKIIENLGGKWGQALFLKYCCLNPLILLLKTSFFDHFLIIPGTLPDHLKAIYRHLVDTRPL